MGRTHLTIVTPSTPTKFHCEHHDTHFDRFPSLIHFLWMQLLIRSNGGASEQDMLVAYESLFLEKCPLCNRFLSAEGYLPPVARIRQEDGTWEPQHGTCVQN